MARRIKVFNPRTNKFELRKTFKRPIGFRKFTDLNMKKSLEKEGFTTTVGRNPFSGRGGKVLFFKKIKRRKI